MIDFFHCKFCGKSIKMKSEKIQINSRYNISLSMSITSGYSVTNPDCRHIGELLEIYINDYNKILFFI